MKESISNSRLNVNSSSNSSLPRRAFLKLTGLAVPLVALLGKVPTALAGRWEQSKEEYWQDGMFSQDNVDMSKYDRGIIRARVDGSWEEYPLVELDDAFMEWNLESRLEYLQTIAEGKMPSLAGPHAAAVATCGGGRLDSHFSLNNAIKGMGFAPKEEHVRKMIDRYKSTMDLSMPEKLEILQENYRRPELWDRTKQVSLELYASPEFETHTFLNIMANPAATIVFTDMPSYELRAIARIVHPRDPRALPFEKNLLEYSNMAHGYFHGGADQRFNLLAFHIIEQFDNSPGSGRGVRVRPPLPEE